MATLTSTHPHKQTTGRLGQCVLIGRKPFNHVALNYPTVSRLHAWILQKSEGYLLSPAGGKNPTRLNDRPITTGELLKDGDVIGIGPVKLVFHAQDHQPADQQWDHLPPMPAKQEDGILFQCACGAPAWVHHKLQQATLRCRHCQAILKAPVIIEGQAAGLAQIITRASIAHSPGASQATPGLSIAKTPAKPASSDQALGMEVVCSVCQCPLLSGETIIECPECGLTFHEECWTENKGCSAYGCKQVGILDPEVQAMAHAATQAPSDAAVEQALADHAQAQAEAHTPWEYLLLALSLLSLAIAAPTFGIPSLAVGILAIRYLRKRNDCKRWAIVLCVVLSGIGFMGGAWSGWVWWYQINLNMLMSGPPSS